MSRRTCDRLVEPEHGDRRGLGRVGLGSGTSSPEVDRTDVDRRLPAELGHPRVRVADVARHHVLQLEGVEGDGRGLGLDALFESVVIDVLPSSLVFRPERRCTRS